MHSENLFTSYSQIAEDHAPLADKLRPKNLKDFLRIEKFLKVKS